MNRTSGPCGRGVFAAITGLAALTGAGAVRAQQDASARLPDVVVTAQKHEQRLQDVPMSISAVTAGEIAARNATDLADLQFSIPGLSSYAYGPGVGLVQIRGVATTIGNQTVGVYLDEMPVNGDLQGSSLDVRLLDIERVEVLKGPQGTLYGEGSMGGTIRYITAAPDRSAFSGAVAGQLGTVADGEESYRASGVVNVPLGARAAARIVAGYERLGGWIENSADGRSDINGVELKTIRGKVLVAPTERLQLTLLALHQETDQDNQHFGRDAVTAASVATFNRDRYTLLNGVLTYAFDGVELLESVGYLTRRTSLQYDLTPFYAPVLQAVFGLPPGAITQVPLPSVTDSSTLTNELRLRSTHDGALRWTVGTYFRRFDSDGVTSTSTAPLALPITLLASRSDRLSRAWAVFGEGEWRASETLSATLGARYFSDRVESTTASTSFGFATLDAGKATFTSFNPRLNLKYEISPSAMVYGGVAKGFRSGGFNLTSAGGGAVAIPPTYAPDKLWTYEIGSKQQWASGRVMVDAAAYRTVWRDVQSSNFAPGSAFTIVQNGGDVRGWGVDLALSVRATEALTLTGAYGWNNLEYQDATADKAVGDPVDGAISPAYSLSADYRTPLSARTTGFARLDFQHAGSAQITLRNFGNQIVRIEARDLLNLRVGAAIGDVEVALVGSNLTNDDAPIVPGPFGVIVENVEQRPRSLGVDVRVSF